MDTLRDRFIQAMSRAAATVSVVTTDGPAGRAGVTVSAMTSVSADGDAPTMLVCINKGASAADPIRRNGVFAINVLEAGQQDLADLFAGRGGASGAARFAGLATETLETGAPILPGLAAFDCEVQDIDPIGTHLVIIGAVRAVRSSETGTPLIYGMRSYLRAERA
ncbi:flavin reductase family protein [Jannaschia seohaensis]|uniref:Flavin reductase/cob(II)yrinic acid a,c-diamide reductase n=1 Tax=Jannaschia seohaensis TaxID=475081 RepID=A0A2Y9ANY5_9RHOB|nr:flavin reductase family protein [Jannaschia seohaensis]PWJ19183.1 flavin reductase/cob(II)yrinic acid a,c-diamide reductase [Jannaschia seohaensis]SSA45845.1 flavin reductase/cob(II)yrinic acid a,c-diamide reductase [Jannaschia seohaensis]